MPCGPVFCFAFPSGLQEQARARLPIEAYCVPSGMAPLVSATMALCRGPCFRICLFPSGNMLCCFAASSQRHAHYTCGKQWLVIAYIRMPLCHLSSLPIGALCCVPCLHRSAFLEIVSIEAASFFWLNGSARLGLAPSKAFDLPSARQGFRPAQGWFEHPVAAQWRLPQVLRLQATNLGDNYTAAHRAHQRKSCTKIAW